jgi:hypothetical protein
MAELVANCPRCGASRITFDLISSTIVGRQYSWQNWHEAFCVCRHCHRSTVFVLADKGVPEAEMIAAKGLSSIKGTVNDYVETRSYISAKDKASIVPPEHLPEDINAVFAEGATCFAVNCYNAAGTMFRLCVDKATRSMLPAQDVAGLSGKVRRNLGLRLPWLLDNKILPEALRDLSACIKDDGNDGAHDGSLSREDAEDLLDFTSALLERLYTEPARLRLAEERRITRRDKGSN